MACDSNLFTNLVSFWTPAINGKMGSTANKMLNISSESCLDVIKGIICSIWTFLCSPILKQQTWILLFCGMSAFHTLEHVNIFFKVVCVYYFAYTYKSMCYFYRLKFTIIYRLKSTSHSNILNTPFTTLYGIYLSILLSELIWLLKSCSFSSATTCGKSHYQLYLITHDEVVENCQKEFLLEQG